MSVQSFTKPQLRILAYASVHGKDAKAIALSCQVSEHRVKSVLNKDDYLTGRQKATFNIYKSKFAMQAQESEMRHIKEMMELVPDAYKVIKGALMQKQDKRLATDQAWKILENANIPVYSDKAQVALIGDVNTQVNVLGTEQAMDAINVAFAGIAKATEGMGRLPHINEGSSHRYVSEAEAIVNVEEAEVEEAE